MGSSGIIENIWISMHSRYFFCGAENVDSSRIIENTFLVERRAREAPESLKTYGFLYTGERGKLQNHENTKNSIHFHYFFGGAESVGSSRMIENQWISIHFHNFFGGVENSGGIIFALFASFSSASVPARTSSTHS